MTPERFSWFEARINEEDPSTPGVANTLELIEHTKALRNLVADLSAYWSMPGPSPEKTAEHYQIVQRVRGLTASMGPIESLSDAMVRLRFGLCR